MKSKNQRSKNLDRNIMVLKFFLIALFLVLAGKFLIITNYYAQGYSELAQYQINVQLLNEMPRGEIYDRNGKLIVGNTEQKNLIYLNNGGKTDEEEWDLAHQLVEDIQIDQEDYNLIENDYKDLIIREDYDTIYSRYKKDEEKYEGKDFEDTLRSLVTKEDYNKLVKEHGEKEVDLKILIDNSSTSTPLTLAKDLSLEDEYYIEQNIGSLGGCFVVSHWERYYPHGSSMRSLLGVVGDIPEEDLDYYESLGYSSADQVGISYIEEQQESYLHPQTQELSLYFDDNGNINNYKTIDEGSSGKDIKLTIDIELQKDIEKILKDNLEGDSYKYYHSNYASVMDVNTGDILALGGIYEDDKDYYDVSINNFTTAYEIGSVVKPAFLLMGYDLGIWDWGTVVNDQPMQLGQGLEKASFYNYGPVDEYKAIQVSSNVYFYTMILKIAGIDYKDEYSLPAYIDEEYFTLVRKELAKFGLGTATGIEFDNEVDGVKNNDRGVGLYMDLANGQYDTYTPLQMTQYITTVANGSARMGANYLYSINEPGVQGEIGREIQVTDKKVMNYLDYDSKDIEHVQETLLEPGKPGGTTYSASDSRYTMGSKSGTSESYYYEPGMESSVKTDNTSFIAYAPYTDPKVGVSVLMPYWTPDGVLGKEEAADLGGRVLDACYDAGYIE